MCFNLCPVKHHSFVVKCPKECKHRCVYAYSVAQSCPTLYDPIDYSMPGSSVCGISQTRILEWVAISSSRGSSWPRYRTHVSCVGRQFLHRWATREAPGRIITAFKNKIFNHQSGLYTSRSLRNLVNWYDCLSTGSIIAPTHTPFWKTKERL